MDGLDFDKVALIYAAICIAALVTLCAGLVDALEYQAGHYRRALWRAEAQNATMLAYLASLDEKEG